MTALLVPYPGIRVVPPTGQSVSVSIATPAGGSASAFLDPFGVSSAALPYTVSVPTILYLAGEGPWEVNGLPPLTLEGNQVATVDLSASGVTVIRLGLSNGVDDTAMVQGAINSAGVMYGATGSPVRITGTNGVTYKCFTYSATATNYQTAVFAANAALTLQSGVILDGLSLLFPDWPGGSASVTGIGDQGTGATIKDWQVINCVLNGQAPGSASTEQNHQAIVVGNSTNFRIANNKITNWRQNGVDTLTTTGSSLSVQHGWIDKNFITLCMGGAVRLHGGQDIWVTDNVAWQCLNATYGALSAPNCILTAGSFTHQGIHITGNRVYDWGIGYDLDGTVTDCEFVGNYNRCPVGGKGNGLQVSSGGVLTRVNIQGNTLDQSPGNFTGNFAAGINLVAQLIDVKIVDNIIKMPTGPCTGAAIDGHSIGSSSVRVEISRNLVSNMTVATAIGGAIYAANVADLKVVDNSLDASAYTGGGIPGIVIASSCSTVVVRGNNVNQATINVGASNSLITGNAVTASWSAIPATLMNINSTSGCLVADNILTQNTGGTQPWIIENSGTGPNVYRGNVLVGSGTIGIGQAIIVATTSIVEGNLNYNPVGVVSPGVPGSGSAVAAVNYARTFYIATGAGTTTMAIQSGPTVTLAASASNQVIRVPAGKTVTPSYTNAPTWVVEGE